MMLFPKMSQEFKVMGSLAHKVLVHKRCASRFCDPTQNHRLHGTFYAISYKIKGVKQLVRHVQNLCCFEALFSRTEEFLGQLHHHSSFNPHPACFANSSAICTALVAAPLRRLSLTHQKLRPFGCDKSLRMRPMKTKSLPVQSQGIG